ncbi:MAG: PD-(D/E)XK nuclease family protein, partial [Acidimicrobiales bacterium]
VIPNRERGGVGLPARGVSRAEERRDYLAALAAAGERTLSFPRADPRAQRARQPARWLLETCTVLSGASRPVYGDDLAHLRGDPRAAAWFRDLESFEFWLARDGSPATLSEHDVGGLLAAHRAGLPLDAAPVVAADPTLARGLQAVAARGVGAFGRWTGFAGGREEFLLELERPQSATALQTWATCPFRYFLGHVLGVAELDDPTDSDEISAMDRGSLVHAILERFVGEQLGRPPTAPWTADDRGRLAELADEVAAEFESEGRTGRTLLWRLHWTRLRRYLDRILTADDELRRALGVAPEAVELGFGFPDDAIGPVSVDAGGGRTVMFRGRIDRVDRSPSGDRMVVLDYKTARARTYPALAGAPEDVDLTGAGRHLQLLVYAHAARAAYGDVPVEARFWFVSPNEEPSLRGGPVDDRAEARFREVLGTIVDGIEHGRFPARPGAETFFGFENCGWCPYNQVCPTGRSELWTRVRRAPELASFVALAESDGGGEP